MSMTRGTPASSQIISLEDQVGRLEEGLADIIGKVRKARDYIEVGRTHDGFLLLDNLVKKYYPDPEETSDGAA